MQLLPRFRVAALPLVPLLLQPPFRVDRRLAPVAGRRDGLPVGMVVDAAADHDHIAVAEEKAVARGARADPAAHQPLLAGQAKQFGFGAGGDDQGVRLVRISALTGDAERATRQIDLDRILADELGAYAL